MKVVHCVVVDLVIDGGCVVGCLSCCWRSRGDEDFGGAGYLNGEWGFGYGFDVVLCLECR